MEESTADKNRPVLTRQKDRYSHIYISLLIRIRREMVWIKALDWNEHGFNLYTDHEITERNIAFKKGTAAFSGEIIWTRKNDNDDMIIETRLNAILFEELKHFRDQKDLQKRAIALIRTQGQIEEKKKLLTLFNRTFSDDEAVAHLSMMKQDHPVYHYGVKVESEEWKQIMQVALDTSSVIKAMEKISNKLTTFHSGS